MNDVVRLPSDVYFCEEPQIVRWDYDNNVWKTDGFVDKLYNECERVEVIVFFVVCVCSSDHDELWNIQ